MSYIEKICDPLAETLNHAVTLQPHQLAGHCANLDFWISEIQHRLKIIDGYQERFDRMKKAQDAYQGSPTYRRLDSGPLKRSTKDNERREIREKLLASIERLLTRCHKEQLIDDATFESALESLGLTVSR